MVLNRVCTSFAIEDGTRAHSDWVAIIELHSAHVSLNDQSKELVRCITEHADQYLC